MMKDEEPKWFEKTVEYAFVRRFADFLACPLDGSLETMGDTIFSTGHTFFLMEFKVDASSASVASERNKYADAEASIEVLRGYSSSRCHWAVFGGLKDQRFYLAMKNYVDFLANIDVSMYANARLLKMSGAGKENFCVYLETVIEEKLKGKKEGGGGIVESLSHMLVVNDQGEVASAFDSALGLNLKMKKQLLQAQEQTQKQTRGHSPGMGGR